MLEQMFFWRSKARLLNFLLLSACHLAECDASIVCLRILEAKFKFCKICFKHSKYWPWGTKSEIIFREHIKLLISNHPKC